MRWFSLSVFIILATFLIGCQITPQAAELPVKPVRIAFMSNRDTSFEIFMMNRDGTETTRLTDLSEFNKVLPAWSSPAKALAFLTNDAQSDDFTLMRMNDEGLDQVTLSADLPVSPSPIAWSPTGEWVSFGTGRDEAAEVYVANRNGESLINLSNHPGEDLFGDWSPDGDQLLIVSDRDQGNLVIYMVAVGGGELTQVTNPMFNSGRPTWSPDGKYIAFMTNRDQGDIEVYIISTEDGGLTNLTNSQGFDGYPKWSPDGTKIAFVSGRENNADIFVMTMNGGELVNLTNTPESNEAPQGGYSWSPDGSQIMYPSDQDGNVEVYVVNVDGGASTNLTNNSAQDFAAIWVQ